MAVAPIDEGSDNIFRNIKVCPPSDICPILDVGDIFVEKYESFMEGNPLIQRFCLLIRHIIFLRKAEGSSCQPFNPRSKI
jgi:hypothetical protein